MAQAALTRPALLTSWSCIGPRHRGAAAQSNTGEGESCENSPPKTEQSEPLLVSPSKVQSTSTIDLPVSSSSAMEWTSEMEYSCSDDIVQFCDDITGADVSEEHTDRKSLDDHMNEVELWHHLEHELYDENGGRESDVVKEIREEEAAAIAEVGQEEPETSSQEMKEVHRFFPPGKIMHIVTFHTDASSSEREGDASPSSENDNDHQHQVETKIGIFLTPRSLYSKLRLSQTMISDHFMPVYRRQIEKLIKELEEEASPRSHNHHEDSDEVIL